MSNITLQDILHARTQEDPSTRLEHAIEKMQTLSRIAREGKDANKMKFYEQINTIQKETLEQPANMLAIRDYKKYHSLLNQMMGLNAEGWNASSGWETEYKFSLPDDPIRREAAEHLLKVAPRLSGMDFFQYLERVDNKNIAVANFMTENGAYGFNTVYAVWKDKRGALKHKEIVNTRNSKDYLHINNVSTDHDGFRVDISTGSEAGEKTFRISNAQLGLQTPSTESLDEQLQRIFPHINAQHVSEAISTIGDNIQNLETTDQTFTGCVIDLDIDGKKIYAKASPDITRLKKEHQYQQDAWKIPLLRAITPRSIDIIENDDLAVLLTEGTQNINTVSQEDLSTYLHKRDTLIDKYSKQQPRINAADPKLTDAFNRALAHTYMKQFKDNPIYSQSSLSSVVEKDEIIDRLCNSALPFADIRTIVEHMPLYDSLVSQAKEFDIDPDVLGHYDAREENVFSNPYDTRPLGDFGLVKPGTAEFDLGKAEVQDIGALSNAYAFFRNHLEQEQENNFELSGEDTAELARKSAIVGYTNAVQVAAFKASKNILSDKHLMLSDTYATQLQENKFLS